MGELESIFILAVISLLLSMPNVAKREQHYSINYVFFEIIITIPNITENNNMSADSICNLNLQTLLKE